MADTNNNLTTNLVDLTLLNVAYRINKKRLDNLREKVITKDIVATNSIEVGTPTTNGSLTVKSGTLTTGTLSVTGGMTIEGGGVILPNKKALSLGEGGSVTGVTTLDSLTGSVKFGNAIDSDGVVTGSAQIVVPLGESLSLSGSANTNSNTTIEGTINSADITVSGSAVLDGSTLKTTTIKNGTIDLNSNDLTVTSDSTITTITEGGTTTIQGVGAIGAKSMSLTSETNNSPSLIINNTYGIDNISKDGDDVSKVALYCTGGITGAKVYNAVWNDLADAIEVPSDTELEFGYCYKYKDGRVYKTDSYADSNILGIHSDTAGMILGLKVGKVKCINLAVAGVVLAYVDKEYECGTALVATKEGKLTKANILTRLFHPERIVGTFYKKELQESWGTPSNKVKVNGRSWVKVK